MQPGARHLCYFNFRSRGKARKIREFPKFRSLKRRERRAPMFNPLDAHPLSNSNFLDNPETHEPRFSILTFRGKPPRKNGTLLG
jgi:hypothetical protein